MKSLIVFLIVGASLTSVSCRKKITPSSEITTETRTFNDFNSVNVNDAMEVQVHFATTEYVEVEANSNLHSYIETDVVGQELFLRMKNNVRIKGNPVMIIHVYTNDLEEIEAYDASSVRFTDSWETLDAKISLKGASSFQGEINALNTYFNLEQASSLSIWGSSENAHMVLEGASSMKDYGFACTDLTISLAGASSAKVTVNNRLSVDARGASTLNYQGDAVIDELNTSGASSVNHN